VAKRPGIDSKGQYGQQNQFQDGLQGVVLAATGGGLFVVEILGKDGKRNGIQVFAKPSGRIRINNVKITAGDTVTVQVSETDPSKGRITWRYK
jgi:translation initiation factor IF-1